ncbi:MAG: hypothetical protein U0172_14630 [Nitrospiraceae bacterium]
MTEGVLGLTWALCIGTAIGIGIGRWWFAGAGRPHTPEPPAPAPATQSPDLATVAESVDLQREKAWEQLAADAVPLIPILTHQLEGVMAQNEAAAVTINERILGMASRVETQTRSMTTLLQGVCARPSLDPVSNAELRTAVDHLLASDATTAKDVAEIVMALQYQDITKQQLQHVVEPLDQLKRSLETLVRGHGLQDPQARSLLAALHKSYTMESERAVMVHALTGTPGATPAQAKTAGMETEGDVTLF